MGETWYELIKIAMILHGCQLDSLEFSDDHQQDKE